MASHSSSHPVALIPDALRASPDAARLWTHASEEIQSSVGLGTGKMDAGFSGAEEYIQFFMGTLEYAIFPHARSPVCAKSLGAANRGMARGWITDKITKNAMDANWIQAPNLSKIAGIFARTVVLMGKCRYPEYISKSRAGQ